MTGDFDILDFQIRNRGLEMRVPVDQTLAAIDQALVVHLDEDLDHGVMEVAFVTRRRVRRTGHGEGVARPIAGRAKTLELFDDRVAVLVFPLPDLRQEVIAAHIRAAEVRFLFQLLFDLKLGGDTRVVLTGLPKGVEAAHTVPADQDVLKRVVKCVAHVQSAGDIRRRDHDGEGFLAARIRARLESSAFFPSLV